MYRFVTERKRFRCYMQQNIKSLRHKIYVGNVHPDDIYRRQLVGLLIYRTLYPMEHVGEVSTIVTIESCILLPTILGSQQMFIQDFSCYSCRLEENFHTFILSLFVYIACNRSYSEPDYIESRYTFFIKKGPFVVCP